ncbi:MAG: hypothetical protein LLF97_12835 [Planctomycetaceae bacterium]|nr:hypothetical protein [Planctomycetaceae bacterium]
MFPLIGIALAVQNWAFWTMAHTIGLDWLAGARHGLIDAGMSEWLVCGWVNFALMDSAEWLAIFLISMGLGLIRSKKVHMAAWLWIIASYGQKLVMAALIGPNLLSLSHPNVLIVWLFIVPIGFAGWWIGYRLRGHDYSRARPVSPAWLSIMLQVVLAVGLLTAAVDGWMEIAIGWSVATNPEFPCRP